MPRPAKKKTRVLAKAQKLGELQAELEWEYKTLKNKKHLFVSIKNHIGKMIDKIEPMELIAVLGATYLIKTGIEWTEEILAGAAEFANIVVKATQKYRFVDGAIQVILEPEGIPELAEIRQALDSAPVEIVEWLLSFMVAYMVVHNFAAIVNAGGSILSLAKTLIGSGKVAAT